jgi:DNA-binding MarR family transcriptional regulator
MGQAEFREIALLIAKMRRLSSASVHKRLSAVGMSLPTYKVLMHLTQEDEVPQHELAWDAAMDPGALSRLIRSLLDDGLVTTRVDPADKRQRFVRITRKGRELERSLSPMVDAALHAYDSILSDEEQRTLIALLSKAYAGVERIELEARAPEARSEPPAARSRAPTRGVRR